MAKRIECGDRVKDSVTGFAGIVTARTEHISGAVSALVEAQSINSALPRTRVFADTRLVPDPPEAAAE